MKPPATCPICGATILADVDGKPQTVHLKEPHDRRRAEDAAALGPSPLRDRLPKPGLYDPPGDPGLPPYVRSLIERRPDLEAQILEEYNRGLRGEKLEPPEQIPLPIPKRDVDELRPPRRAFGYGEDD